MVKIRKHIVPPAIANKVTYNGKNGKQYIVIHETANKSKGANADAHARLQANGNNRSASWHYQVDDKGIMQSFSDDAQCWHAGNASYNRNSIGIEICVNSDGNYKKAVENAAELVKYLMAKHNISLNNIVQHNHASGKNCPRFMRAGTKGVTWGEFIKLVGGKSKSGTNTSKPNKPQTKPAKTNNKKLGLVDYMKSKNMDSSYNNRKKLAAQYGISNYRGTANQNNILLSKIKAGEPKKASKPKTTKKGNQTTNSLVDYLKSINVNSGFNNRKKLAAQHGIRGYKGTASQNTALLNKMRGGSTSTKNSSPNIKQLADKIERTKITGNEARRKYLGVDKATYEKVRAEINRRYR